jgi:hypothetical protein
MRLDSPRSPRYCRHSYLLSVKIAVAMDGENRFAFGTEAQTTTPCKVSSEDSGGHASSLNSTHYRVPDHCYTSIIVRINLPSSDLTHHLKTLVEERYRHQIDDL